MSWRLGFTLMLLATQPWCWCGAQGAPRPPQAAPDPAASRRISGSPPADNRDPASEDRLQPQPDLLSPEDRPPPDAAGH